MSSRTLERAVAGLFLMVAIAIALVVINLAQGYGIRKVNRNIVQRIERPTTAQQRRAVDAAIRSLSARQKRALLASLLAESTTRELRGATGAVGPQGARGQRGADGRDGQRGEVGPAGPIGPPGPKGDTGRRGPIRQIDDSLCDIAPVLCSPPNVPAGHRAILRPIRWHAP